MQKNWIYRSTGAILHIANAVLENAAEGYAKTLFTRKQGESKDDMTFGASMRGGERKVAFFKNQAYLSVAGRNPSAPSFLRSVYRYFKERMTQIRLNDSKAMLYNPRFV